MATNNEMAEAFRAQAAEARQRAAERRRRADFYRTQMTTLLSQANEGEDDAARLEEYAVALES